MLGNNSAASIRRMGRRKSQVVDFRSDEFFEITLEEFVRRSSRAIDL